MHGSKSDKFLISILNWQVSSSSIFASFFIVMTHKPPVNFKLIHFQLWTKESYQSLNFETFKCSGENLPNSSCHFLKHKSVFLEIFHKYSLSSNITPLYFFRSNVIYFARKGAVLVEIFETFECLDQNSPNSYHFWNNKLVFLQILHHSKLSCRFKHEGFCEISPNHSKVQKFHFNGLFCPKYMRFELKNTEELFSLHWTVVQNLNELWPCGFKNAMRN